MFCFSKKKVFPTFAVIVLVVAVIWFLSGLGYFTLNIPWLPLIIGLIALGWIVNYYQK